MLKNPAEKEEPRKEESFGEGREEKGGFQKQRHVFQGEKREPHSWKQSKRVQVRQRHRVFSMDLLGVEGKVEVMGFLGGSRRQIVAG